MFKNNNVPTGAYSRQHYMKNVSFISADEVTWKDAIEDNATVCLKVYTVEAGEDNDTNDTPTPQPKQVPTTPNHSHPKQTTLHYTTTQNSNKPTNTYQLD